MQDQTLARNNQTTTATRLQLITVPAGLSGSGLVAQGLGDGAADSTVATGLQAMDIRASEAPAASRGGAGSASSAATISRLRPQALAAALSALTTDDLPSSKRADSDSDPLDSDLLELLASAGR